MVAVVERLGAHAVAHQPHLALAFIPQRKRKHAAQPLERANAPLLERVQNDFGVGVVRLPRVTPLGHQLAANFRVVVDLSIEHDLQRPSSVLIG